MLFNLKKIKLCMMIFPAVSLAFSTQFWWPRSNFEFTTAAKGSNLSFDNPVICSWVKGWTGSRVFIQVRLLMHFSMDYFSTLPLQNRSLLMYIGRCLGGNIEALHKDDPGAEIACLLVRAPESWSKGCELESRQERRENFLLQSQLCVLTFIRCPFYPHVYRSGT